MTNPCNPASCRYPLRVGSLVLHGCDPLFMQPVEPAKPRHLKAVS